MPGSHRFLSGFPARLLTLVLLCQSAAFYIFARSEVIPQNISLVSVPQQFGSWTLQEEGVIDQEIKDVLKADELLSRSYVNTSIAPPSAHLFVAYFKSQRSGRAPHSPRNCLPGSGWVPSISDIVHVDIPGRAPIEANRYVVQKGNTKSLVLYWYQSRDRVVADEYKAKFYVVADALRYNRTDTALIRVIVPIVNDNVAASQKTATEFVQSFFEPLRQHFPA